MRPAYEPDCGQLPRGVRAPGYRRTMIARRSAASAVALTLVLALAAGCSAPGVAPAPEDTATTTPDTDEAAFRAAEQTYRAYVDALNARRSDSNSRIDPLGYLGDAALEAAESTRSQLAEADLRVSGPTSVVWIELRNVNGTTATLASCVDSSEARVLDRNGTDVTPESRVERQALLVTVDTGRSLITSSETEAEGC